MGRRATSRAVRKINFREKNWGRCRVSGHRGRPRGRRQVLWSALPPLAPRRKKKPFSVAWPVSLLLVYE
eukprot:5340411-Prymnesium_polylepis.1